MDNFQFEEQQNSSDFDIIEEIGKYLKYWYLFIISIFLLINFGAQFL